MSRARSGVALVVVVLAVAAVPPDPKVAIADTSTRPGTAMPASAGTLLVGVEPGSSPAERADIARHARATAAQPAAGDVLALEVRPGDSERAARDLRHRSDVRYVEPNAAIRATTTPNDPAYPAQWELQPPASTSGGVGAPTAWDTTTGSAAVVVGVLDTGVDVSHPDLAPNVWSNPGGIGGCAAGTHGYDAVHGSCDPLDDMAGVWHGTHVAGTIGAAGDNGVGIAGMNWTTRIMGLKMLGADGAGTVQGAIVAITFAIQAKQAGVNVRALNASWSGASYSQALADAITAAGDAGILFVAAAGNSGLDVDPNAAPTYPCSYALATEVCVAASDHSGARASFSNYGATTVDLAAPGVDILSTAGGGTGGYRFLNGTSMATPHVTGAAALTLALPQYASISASQLKAVVVNAVVPVASLAGKVRSGGRLDLAGLFTGGAPKPRAHRVARARARTG